MGSDFDYCGRVLSVGREPDLKDTMFGDWEQRTVGKASLNFGDRARVTGEPLGRL